MILNWKVTKDEFEAISQIANRAVAWSQRLGVTYPVHNIAMDLTAVHKNGCPLRLDELSHAPDGEFCHDIFGIRRHINRETGKLMNCFVPRFAK